MSVIGVDLGTAHCILAQAKRGGVDIVLNEGSNRQNSVLVAFGGKERYIGEAAVPQVRSNYANTVTQIKRLIGRKFSEPEVQHEIANFLGYRVVQLPDDEIGIELAYNDGTEVFTPQQIVGMFLAKMKALVNTATGQKACDVVISVPSFFNDAQRHAIFDAAKIGGVNCLRVLNEASAVALQYGLHRSAKGEFDDSKETFVMFLDMGHSSFTVSIVGFVKGKLRIVATACERNAGGRDLDAAIARHIANEFQAKYRLDSWASKKSRMKLMSAAEKAKKDLSPYGVNQCPINIECLMEDRDFHMNLTLEQLNTLCEPVVARLDTPLQLVLSRAGLPVSALSAIEIVGGGMRPRCVKQRVAKVLGLPSADDHAGGYGLSTTMNMDEAVSRGCAYECAMISPLFVVKAVQVVDYVTYPIRVSWDASAAGGASNDAVDDEEEEKSAAPSNSVVLFPIGSAYPVTKRITFKTVEPFTITASYDASAESCGLSLGTKHELGVFRVSGVPEDVAAAAKADPSKTPRIRVDFTLDANGLLKLDKAELMKEVAEEEPAAAEAAPAASSDAAAPPPKKKRYTRVPLAVEANYTNGYTAAQIAAFVAREAAIADQDRVLRETRDKRNELEGYIYDMRNKLSDSLSAYATEVDKANLLEKLNAAESWLYGDGFDEAKSVYQMHLDQLRSLGDPVSRREYEFTNRPEAVKVLGQRVEYFKKIALSTDVLYEHLTEEDRSRIKAACKEAEDWIADQLSRQARLPLHADPVVRLTDIDQAGKKLHNIANPIATKPKPKPVPPPAPAPEPAPAAPPAADAPADSPAPDAAGKDVDM